MEQKPSVGRIVHYKLSAQDVEIISAEQPLPGGDPVAAGDVTPLIITRVSPDGLVSGKCVLDGYVSAFWVPSRREGAEPGTWNWPPRV